MIGSPAKGTKGGASTRKGWPERVIEVAGSMRSPSVGTYGDDNAGATCCGGRYWIDVI